MTLFRVWLKHIHMNINTPSTASTLRHLSIMMNTFEAQLLNEDHGAQQIACVAIGCMASVRGPLHPAPVPAQQHDQWHACANGTAKRKTALQNNVAALKICGHRCKARQHRCLPIQTMHEPEAAPAATTENYPSLDDGSCCAVHLLHYASLT